MKYLSGVLRLGLLLAVGLLTPDAASAFFIRGGSSAAAPVVTPFRNIASSMRAPGFNAAGLTNGTVNTQNGRASAFNESGESVTAVKVIFSGWYTTNANEVDAPNSYTVTASIEYPAGTFTQVKWSGSSSHVVAPGVNDTSDSATLATPIPAGAQYWVRDFISVPTGQKWPVTSSVWQGGEQGQLGTDLADVTMGGTISGFVSVLRPSAVLAQTGKTVSIAYVGDSIGAGSVGDNYDSHGNISGYAKAATGYCGVIAASVSGAPLAGQSFTKRLDLFQKAGVTHVINELGINDVPLSSAATLEANLLSFWQSVNALGMKPVQITYTPKTASTDNWQTTGNQSVVATGFTGGAGSVRSLVNAYTRTKPSPLFDYIEVANAVEPAQDSGIWIAGSTYSSRLGAVDSWVVGSASTTTSVTSNSTQAANYYASPGAIVFTSGALAGTRAVVTSNTSGGTFTIPALASVPSAGDTFLAYPSSVQASADGLHPSSMSATLSLGGHYILRDQTLAKLLTW